MRSPQLYLSTVLFTRQLSKSLILSSAALALLTWGAPSAMAQGGAGYQTAPAAASKLDDPTIVAIFDAANTWDIETGGLAVKKGSRKDIRDFGAMLVRDHTMVRQQGRDLAKKLGVHPTSPKDFPLQADHTTAMKQLRALTGSDFDRAFLEHEVTYHKAVIDDINTTLLPAIQNAELKALVVKVVPAFQAHLLKAQSLLDSMGKK